MTTIRQQLERKYMLARGTTKCAHLSDVELCLGILADDQEDTRGFAELYRGWLLGDNPKNPITMIAERYSIYHKPTINEEDTGYEEVQGS